ncbi:MAG: single-stranded DNA-binding protein [Firmicutes bacterium]|nr:single-stranded DNA-binding protein [Bacillota bacterium]
MIYEKENKVFLSGMVERRPEWSHEVFGEGFYEFMLGVTRLSDQKDLLPVTVSERLLEEYAVNPGDQLALNGQFRSYNKIVDGKSKLMLTVFVRDFCAPDPSKNPNVIELEGYVCKPPVYRTTPFKREICDLLLAVNRAYNKSDYIPCIAWGRNARFAKNIPVGERTQIAGRIQSRIYQKKLSETEIEERTAYEISVNKIKTGGDSFELNRLDDAAAVLED